MVSDEEVARFRRDGFLRIDMREILGDVVIDRLRERVVEMDEAGWPDHPDTKPYPGALLVRPLHKFYPEAAAFALSPRLGELAARLLGVEHIRVTQDGVFNKRPGMMMTPWHQDLPSVPYDRPEFLSVWTAMDDIEVETGAMRYVPGSHKLGPVGSAQSHMRESGLHGEPDDVRTLLSEEQLAEVGEVVHAPLRPGEAMIHSGMLLHGANPNRSDDRPRRGFDVAMVSAETRYTGLYNEWFEDRGLIVGEIFDHPAFPVIY
jgi:hypothetical protein